MPEYRALVHGHRPRGKHRRRLPGHAIRQHHGLRPGIVRLLHYSAVRHGDPRHAVEASHARRRVLGTALRYLIVDFAVSVGETPSRGARDHRPLFARQANGREPVPVHMVVAGLRHRDGPGQPRDQTQTGFGTAGFGIRPVADALRTSRPVLSTAHLRSGDRRRGFHLPHTDLLVNQMEPDSTHSDGLSRKQRMRRALRREPVDRIPTQSNYTRLMGRLLAGHFGIAEAQLPQRLGNPLLRVHLDYARRTNADGSIEFDWWGAGWDPRTEGYWHAFSPLKDSLDLDRVAWPDPNDPAILGAAERTILQQGATSFIVPNLGMCLF